jgi:L-lactate dehydrogenase complex protein LldG
VSSANCRIFSKRGWDPTHIPIPGLAAALDRANITCVAQNAAVRVGLTGVNAALAATGSLVLLSGSGRSRAASLLPPVHIAVVAADQIVADLESWWVAQTAAGLDHIRQCSNVVIITGPSRTADIAMQLIMGMHGPRELHLIICSN